MLKTTPSYARLRQYFSVACNFMALPNDIKEIFLQTLTGDMTIASFEGWLYSENRLEEILSPEEYLELISYGYQSETARNGLPHLLLKHIDKGEFERRSLKKLLVEALEKTHRLPKILMQFYKLYCQGYYFLNVVGLEYGLAVKVPDSTANSWEYLTMQQQTAMINGFYPQLEFEIKKIIDWLDHGAIALTGTVDEDGHFTYVDHRVSAQSNTAPSHDIAE